MRYPFSAVSIRPPLFNQFCSRPLSTGRWSSGAVFGEAWFAGGTLNGIPEYVARHFSWNRFVAIQIWIFVLFLIYTIGAERNSLFGNGELIKILFTRRSSELKLSRRQRIRTLVRLSRLTETHTLDELRDREPAAHMQMMCLISGLAMRKTPSKPDGAGR